MSDVEDMSWADGDADDGFSEELELVDLTEVRAKYQQLIENGDLATALGLLDQVGRWPDTTRYLEDNLWLYTKLGDISRASERDEDALDAYHRAFELDPRELDVLRPYSELLFHHGRNEDGLKVVQSMLLHHKRKLPSNELVTIYRQMGAFYEGMDELEKARASFDKALEQDPDDHASLENLLRVVGKLGEPLDVVRVRQKLIRTLKDSKSRSQALVELGDDWAYKFNDTGRALDVYEQAVTEWRENKDALERLAKMGAEAEDWRRVTRAYHTLGQMAETPEEEADWLVRSAIVYRDELWEADKALEGFKRALNLDPRRLEAFKAVTSILVDAKDWEALEAAYVQLITANVEAGNDDPRLMGVLWSKLGELYQNHLGRTPDAIFAYDQASSRLPQSMQLHASVAELAESDEANLDLALSHLQSMRRLEPGNLEHLERIGRVYLRKKDVDKAWCVFRALEYLGAPLDDKAKNFVGRFNTALFRPIKRPFTPDVMQRIYSPNLDADVTEVFRCLKPGLDEWTGEAHSKYGLKRKDRLKLDAPLAFNNIYKSVGATLGYKTLPDLWHKPDQEGLINGALVPEGMLAGDDILASGREEYTAFIVGKQLFLYLAPFYLAAIRPLSDLQVFVILGAALVRSDVDFDMSEEMRSALKAMKKRIKGDGRNALARAVGRITNRETDLGAWLEAVEDTANRVGLIFCDDLDAAREYLTSEPQPLGARTVDQKMATLVEYSISQEYFQLRQALGITLG